MVSVTLFVLFSILASAHAFDVKGRPFARRVASPHNNAAFMPRRGPQMSQHQARPAFLASPAPKRGDSTALNSMDPHTSLIVAESSVTFKDVIFPVVLVLAAAFYTIEQDPRYVSDDDDDDDTIPLVVGSISGFDQEEDYEVVTKETPVKSPSPTPVPEEASVVVTEEMPVESPSPTPVPEASVEEDDSTSTESPTQVEPKKSAKNSILSLVKALYFPWLGMVFDRFK